MESMTNVFNSHVDFDLKMLRLGGVLAGTGMVLASAGTALVGIACTKAARDWVRQLEHSPGSIAADKIHKAKDASNAAMQAWRSAAPVNGAVSR